MLFLVLNRCNSCLILVLKLILKNVLFIGVFCEILEVLIAFLAWLDMFFLLVI